MAVIFLTYPHIVLSVAFALLYVVDSIALEDGNTILGLSGSSGRIFDIVSPGRGVIVFGKVMYFLPLFRPWLLVHRLRIIEAPNGIHAPNPRKDVLIAIVWVGSSAFFLSLLVIFALGNNPIIVLASLLTMYITSFFVSILTKFFMKEVGWIDAMVGAVFPPAALNLMRKTSRSAPRYSPRTIGHDQGSKELAAISSKLRTLSDIAGYDVNHAMRVLAVPDRD